MAVIINMSNKKSAINLLPREEFDASILGRTLRWATGTFRIIVIVTEMLVMGAFLSRFWLDAQNSDLSDSIKIKSAQIVAQADTEKEFRGIQSKLNIVKQIGQISPPSQTIDAIISKLPPDVNLTAVSVSENSAQINGTSASELGIAQFITNLKGDTFFKNVNLGQINSSESNLTRTVFSINILY